MCGYRFKKVSNFKESWWLCTWWRHPRWWWIWNICNSIFNVCTKYKCWPVFSPADKPKICHHEWQWWRQQSTSMRHDGDSGRGDDDDDEHDYWWQFKYAFKFFHCFGGSWDYFVTWIICSLSLIVSKMLYFGCSYHR